MGMKLKANLLETGAAAALLALGMAGTAQAGGAGTGLTPFVAGPDDGKAVAYIKPVSPVPGTTVVNVVWGVSSCHFLMRATPEQVQAGQTNAPQVAAMSCTAR